MRFHKLLIDPEGHALLDSMGRRLASQARPSPPTTTVEDGFVQLYVPALVTSPVARTAGPDIAGVVSSPPHTAGPASTGPASARPASSSAHTTRPSSKLGPGQARAAYSCLLEKFLTVVCTSKQLPPVSHDVVHHIVTHGPPVASKLQKLDSEKLVVTKAEFKQLEEENIIQCSTYLWSTHFTW